MYHMELCKRTRKYTSLSTSAEDILDGLESKRIRIAYNSSNLKTCSPMENDSGKISEGNSVLEEIAPASVTIMQNGSHMNGLVDNSNIGGGYVSTSFFFWDLLQSLLKSNHKISFKFSYSVAVAGLFLFFFDIF